MKFGKNGKDNRVKMLCAAKKTGSEQAQDSEYVWNARIGMKTSNGRGMRGGEEDGEREGVDFGWNAGRSV